MSARRALICGAIIGTCATALALRRTHAPCRADIERAREELRREIVVSERALDEERAWCRYWRERTLKAEARP